MLSRFYLIPERHGQTDGGTDGRTDRQISILLYKYRASVCGRDIKMLFILWEQFCKSRNDSCSSASDSFTIMALYKFTYLLTYLLAGQVYDAV